MNNRNHTKIFELIICKMYNMIYKLQDKPENNLSIEIHFVVYLMFLSTCSTKNQCTHRNRQLHEHCYSFHENLPVKILFFIPIFLAWKSYGWIFTFRNIYIYLEMSEFTTRASCAARQNKPTGLPPGSTTDSLFCLRVFQSFLCKYIL
jgi:hypothetical protein